MRNRKWKIAAGVGAAALIAGGVAGVAGIASADPSPNSTDRVDGFEDIKDDWNDHEREVGVLCDGCENSDDTDLVTMWQSVLTAEGYLTVDQIDGDFGAETAEATEKFQHNYELDITGQLDKTTWGIADDNLSLSDDGYTVTYMKVTDESHLVMERDPDDGDYGLFGVTDAEGTSLVNNGDGAIWLFDEHITLEPEES